MGSIFCSLAVIVFCDQPDDVVITAEVKCDVVKCVYVEQNTVPMS